MSSATPLHQSPNAPGLYGAIVTCIEYVSAGVRAAAFWTAALLPLVVLGAVATGAANQYPTALGAALTLSVVSAVVGHGHHAPEQ